MPITSWHDQGHDFDLARQTLFNNNRKLLTFVQGDWRPFDDPKGKWRVGGGINVPVKIEMQAARSSISELKE